MNININIDPGTIILALFYLVAAPLFGGLLTGLDRIITARMQGRYGPPLFQPFYDVLKLYEKESIVVRRSQNIYILFFLIFTIFTGGLFFTGGDLLLVIFSLTLAGIFLVLAGFKASSPYGHIGAERELIQILAYEPMVLLTAAGMYMVTKSFFVKDILNFNVPVIYYLPGIFIGFVYILTIKLRKSPYDLSTSHHGHQEIVKGITTEFSGPALGMIEIAHWYEVAFIMGFIYLFFAPDPLIAVSLALLVYFLEIVIDNAFARAKWQVALASSWLFTLVFGFSNIVYLFIWK
ncbi:MAG: complex I subunit 1 family protein [Candidatus Margulisiibacteriota bacterium]|jgi:formate hydrogenlyase subunit 4